MLHLIICLFILISIKLGWTYWRRQRQLKPVRDWYGQLNLAAHESAFYDLYQTVNGFQISHAARKAQDAFAYTYGEIECRHFVALLSLAHPNTQTVFYDLGSGIGKAVFACAMVFPVQKSVGVEILLPLHLTACQQKNRLRHLPQYAAIADKIELRHADFLETGLEDATLIFINATAFFSPLWEELGARLHQLTSLQTVITTSRSLTIPSFHIQIQTQVQMSWGIVTAFVHQRN